MAALYMAPLDQAEWSVEKSPLACRLRQRVPKYGEAIFETVAGGRQTFAIVAAKHAAMEAGPSLLIADAPSWNPEREPIELGRVEVGSDRRQVQLDAEPAQRVLEALHDGLVPGLARPERGDTAQMARIEVSPVRFRRAYAQYNVCIAQLLPLTLEQIVNTIVEFDVEQVELNVPARKKIDLLLRYVKADPSITGFDIIALSADRSRLLGSLELAKQRAQQVNDYLVGQGIEQTAINVSYRGERGRQGDARRYVAIRLKREKNPS